DPDRNLLMAVLTSPPPSGTLTLNTDGSFSYVPPPTFDAPVTFQYRATDGLAASAPVTVTLVPMATTRTTVAAPAMVPFSAAAQSIHVSARIVSDGAVSDGTVTFALTTAASVPVGSSLSVPVTA